MKGILIVISVLIAILIVIIVADFIIYFMDSIDVLLCWGAKEHAPDYDGITEITLFGKKDIFCPKCKSSDCTYVYFFNNKQVFPFERLRNRKKFILSEAIIDDIIDTNAVEKYKCKNCGYIFK